MKVDIQRAIGIGLVIFFLSTIALLYSKHTKADWEVTEYVDIMTDSVSYFAQSPYAETIYRPDFPYDDVRSRLRYECHGNWPTKKKKKLIKHIDKYCGFQFYFTESISLPHMGSTYNEITQSFDEHIPQGYMRFDNDAMIAVMLFDGDRVNTIRFSTISKWSFISIIAESGKNMPSISQKKWIAKYILSRHYKNMLFKIPLSLDDQALFKYDLEGAVEAIEIVKNKSITKWEELHKGE